MFFQFDKIFSFLFLRKVKKTPFFGLLLFRNVKKSKKNSSFIHQIGMIPVLLSITPTLQKIDYFTRTALPISKV